MMISPDRDIRCNKHMMLNGIGVILVDASRSEEQIFIFVLRANIKNKLLAADN